MRMFRFVDRTPFIFLGVLVFAVYSCLFLYNWSSWKTQYYDDGVYKYRPLVYSSKVKIQEDKRKIFPERRDIFVPTPYTSITLDPIRRASLMPSSRKCAQFDAYIYPLKENASSTAIRLHKQLLQSRYTVSSPNNACIFVAILENAENADSLDYLKGQEDDHLIYLLNGTFAENSKIKHFFGSDVLGNNGLFLEVEDDAKQKWQPERPIYAAPKFLTLQIHTDHFDSNALIGGCSAKKRAKNAKCIYTNSLKDITRNQAKFIFIGYTEARKFHTAFYATLLSGAVPVVNALNLNILPMSDLIEWDKAVIRAPPSQLHNLLDFLEQLDSPQLMEMRRKGHFYFQNYLSDSKVLIRSTLSAVRYRFQIPAPLEHPVKANLMSISKLPANYTFHGPLNLQSKFTSLHNARYVFNVDPTFLDTYSPHDQLWQSKWISNTGPLIAHWTDGHKGMKFSSKLNGNVPNEEFTIVINAFKRNDQLKYTLGNLKGLRFLRYIIVLWSNVKRKPPPIDFWPQIHVPIHFISAKNGSLNERFLPYDLIETEAVFSMDDDFEATNSQIEFAFRVWRENRDVLVGPNERLGYTNPLTKRGIYKTEEHCRYNIILTSGSFLHRNYLYAYWTTMPAAVRTWVDKVTNCEDIAMNFLIAHLVRKPHIKVTPIFTTSGSFTNGVGLSKKREHMWNREKCMQVFEDIYGYNPLLLSESRVDSTHYQHDQKYQCFKDT